MIDDAIATLATGKNFAALSTLLPSGQPQTHIMWVDADDEHILINTEVHRSKYKNVVRDPRATVTIFDAADPYHYGEVRGRVVGEVRGSEAREHIEKLSQKYTGGPYQGTIASERVILMIAPERQRSQ